MLEPRTDRLDYGHLLSPPEGYELAGAIATTYSLDLDALLAVQLALCFNDTLDGDIRGEKLVLLEALGQLKGKLKVYYQKGNIKYPSQYNRLFTLLEPCLYPVIPEGGAFSSFHPKLWLLRFIKSQGAKKKANVHYRLLTLSRNLSFDRSWDLAVALEGKKKTENSRGRGNTDNLSWLSFIRQLLDQDDTFAPGKTFQEELKYLEWEPPGKFARVQLMAGGKTLGRPIHIPQKNNDILMVVSPYIRSAGGKIDALDWLSTHAPTGEKYLFSRAEELNAIGVEKLSDWSCYAINHRVVSGEERLELNDSPQNAAQPQNLHAKLIINKKGSSSTWHIGSANVTTAALGDADNDQPRNTESMVRLSGASKRIRPEELKKQWIEEGLFVEHSFQSEKQEGAGNTLEPILRRAVYILICSKWNLTCHKTENHDAYNLNLRVELKENLPNGTQVEVGQLATAGPCNLGNEMCWKNVGIANISNLIPVHVSVKNGEDFLEKWQIIEASLEIEGGDHRSRYIFKDFVDNKEKIFRYMRLLLQAEPDKNQWMAADGDGQSPDLGKIFSGPDIFEQLLIASSRHPQLLKRIAELLKRLKNAGIEVPEEFQDLWVHFRKEIKD